jgi:hypothetical protein
MQLQGLKLMLFILVIVPAIILFSNHNVFFIVVALIILFDSFKCIFNTFSNIPPESSEEEDETLDELEELADLDVKKFGTGVKVVKDLIALLLFIYSCFYINSAVIGIVASAVIVYRVYKILKCIGHPAAGIGDRVHNWLKKSAAVVFNLGTIVLIGAVAYDKYFRIYT